MESLFGLQMSTLAYILLATLAVVLLAVAAIAVSNRFLIRLSLRNLPRRPAQTVLIIVGLMLATTIVAASFAVGDTITVSIREAVVEGIGDTDIVVRRPAQAGFTPPSLSPDEVDNVIAQLEGESAIDGVMPTLTTRLPVLNQRTQLTEARSIVRGFDVDGLYGTIDVPDGPNLVPFSVPNPIEGTSNDMRQLAEGQVFINLFLQRELDAQVGDNLTVFAPTGEQQVTVAAILDRGGIASANPRMMLPLPHLNRMLGEPDGSADRVDIALDTNTYVLEDASDDLRSRLAVTFVDTDALNSIHSALAESPTFIQLLDDYIAAEEVQGGALDADQAADLRAISDSLKSGAPTDRFTELITSPQILGLVFAVTADNQDPQIQQLIPQLAFGVQQITQLQVTEIKVDGIAVANAVGNIFVTFFTFFGSFTVIVGLLLVFLIFVLLASERMQEMGISRAVGLKRGHLVQMFTFEGLAYAIGSAIVGTAVGIAASRFLVILMAGALGGAGGDNFVWRFSITQWSIAIAFSLGLVLTFLTVIYSATRVSRLNIVVAIRDLPEEFAPSGVQPIGQRLLNFALWIVGPIYVIYLLVTRIRSRDNIGGAIALALATWLVVGWIVGVLGAFFRIWWPYLSQGWPLAIIGAVLTAIPYLETEGFLANAAWLVYIGASIAVYGIGMLIRTILIALGIRDSAANRIGYTATGIVLLVMWALPTRFVEPITGELNSNIAMFILAGVWMVASAVWVVMYNSDLLVGALSTTMGRFRTFTPVLKPAVAYAVNNRFRTGLTVSMFALVIFVMMAFSILTGSFNTLSASPELISGGFDIRAETEPDLPIADINQRIADASGLDTNDFQTIAGQSDEATRARQIGADDVRLLDLTVRGSEPDYFRSNRLQLQAIDSAYLPAGIDMNDSEATARAIWNALADDPTLAVLTDEHFPAAQQVVGDGDGLGGAPEGRFIAEGYAVGSDADFTSFEVELITPNEASQGATDTISRTVIGITDGNADSLEGGTGQGPAQGFIGMHTRHDVFQELTGDVPPFSIYRIMLREGADPSTIAGRLETEFIGNSMIAVDTQAEIDRSQAANQQFNLLFQGFMGLGLVVGAASVGVLAMRAVNERRKHIAIMRALGYRAMMIRAGFIIESVFVAVVGTVLGVILGAIVAWSFLDDNSGQVSGLAFGIPWRNVSIVVAITIIAALITTYIPARQASRIYPAEALRFE